MRRRIWACFIVLPVAVAGSAGCSSRPTWTPFFEGDGVTYSYDTGSIRRFVGGTARISILEDHAAPVIDRISGQDYTSATQHWELSCNAKTLSRLSVVEFSGPRGTGTNLSDTSDLLNVYADPQTLQGRSREDEPVKKQAREQILPGSPEAALLEILCS